MQKVIDALKREKSNNIKKNNILKILESIGAIFPGNYLHYGELFKETKFERSIADRVKLRKKKGLLKLKKKKIYKQFIV